MRQTPPIWTRSAASLPATLSVGSNHRHRATKPLLLTLAILCAAGLITFAILRVSPGMLTRHMATHIFAMSVVAPALAWVWHPFNILPVGRSSLILSTLIQLFLFGLWHSPVGMQSVADMVLGEVLMMVSLLASAVWFWVNMIEAAREDRLEAVPALLVTGKLVCLMAALMVFAPRLLFQGGHAGAALQMTMLGDQQLAGLIMLVACPLTYVGAAVYLVARWLSRLPHQPEGRREA